MVGGVGRLSGSERAALSVAERELALIGTQASPDAIFRAIARCVPIAGGLIGTLGAEKPDTPVSHIVGLPAPVIEGWASTPADQLTRMLAPMVGAGSGELVSDTQALVGPDREEIDLLRRLDAAGLGESAGYKVSTRAAPSGRPVHLFMTFALERKSNFTGCHRASLSHLLPSIEAALDRVKVPLMAFEPIHMQVLNERSEGMATVSRDGRIVEINQRMYELMSRYSRAARVDGGRGALARFVRLALEEAKYCRPWLLRHGDGRSLLDVSTHWLAKESHVIGDDLMLLRMREIEIAEPPPLDGLTKRQQEIAELLARTGLSYKEIADKLALSEATVRTHVERIYRALGVHSRAELSAKLR